jgi:hypothetical protein
MNKSNAKRLAVFLQLGIGVLCVAWVGAVLAFLLLNGNPREHLSTEIRHARHNQSQFVFADLDGDQKPDLALVEMQGQSSQSTNYSIRLQFSRGMEFAIGVRAPFGGLRVAARDVNGDDNLDLILTSNLDSSFIEVLLNDGHGNFSVASAEVLEKEGQSEHGVQGPAAPQADQASLALARSSMEEGLATESNCLPITSSSRAEHRAVEPVLQCQLFVQPGRSPPQSSLSHHSLTQPLYIL